MLGLGKIYRHLYDPSPKNETLQLSTSALRCPLCAVLRDDEWRNRRYNASFSYGWRSVFSCFRPFGGKVLNKKLQIPHDLLPARKAADPGFLARSITIQTWTYAMAFSESHSNGPATGG
jgi:hypothetical protein